MLKFANFFNWFSQIYLIETIANESKLCHYLTIPNDLRFFPSCNNFVKLSAIGVKTMTNGLFLDNSCLKHFQYLIGKNIIFSKYIAIYYLFFCKKIGAKCGRVPVTFCKITPFFYKPPPTDFCRQFNRSHPLINIFWTKCYFSNYSS